MAVNSVLLQAIQGGLARESAKKQRRAESLAALASLGGAAVGGLAGGLAGEQFDPANLATGLAVGQAAGQTLGGLAAGPYGHAAALQGAQIVPAGFNPMIQQKLNEQKAQSLADVAQGKFVGVSGQQADPEQFRSDAARQGYFEGKAALMAPPDMSLTFEQRKALKDLELQNTLAGIAARAESDLETRPKLKAAEAKIELETAEPLAAAQERGKTAAGKEAKQEQKRMAAVNTLNLLDQLESHPGRASVVGSLTGAVAQRIPGTDAAGFRALLDQFEGQAFLQGIEQARGTGPLSDAEGRRITSALSRVANTAQNDRDWQNAVNDLRRTVTQILGEQPQQSGTIGGDMINDLLKRYGE